MDDPIFKTKYQKYKYKVKLWEKQFTAKNGRVPSKHDIREAPTSVRDSYKMYYKLKTSFLEETLSDALEDDAFDLSILENSSLMDSSLSASLSEISTADLSLLTSDNSVILPNNSATSTTSKNIIANLPSVHSEVLIDKKFQSKPIEFEAEISLSVNEKAWGHELNQAHSTAAISNVGSSQDEAGSRLRKTMSDKLFRNSSFAKRNPRKTLSKSSLASSQSSQSLISCSQKEVLPDLETILSQKSQHLQSKEIESVSESTEEPITLLAAQGKSNLTNSIDYEWLNRCNQSNSIHFDSNELPPVDTLISKSSEQTRKFGISNINANALANYESVPLTSDACKKSMLSFDMNNLNLKVTKSFDNRTLAPVNNFDDNDDDEEIANSEDETEKSCEPKIRSIRHVNKRKYSEFNTPIKSNEKPIELPSAEQSNEMVNDNNNVVRPKSVKKTAGAKRKRSTARVEETAVRRKSTRFAHGGSKKYAEIKLSDSGSEQEIDPFACDDSDADPDFAIDKETASKKKNTSDESNESSSNDTNEKNSQKVKKSKSIKTTTKTVRKRVIRVSQLPRNKTSGHSVKPKISKGKKQQNNHNNSNKNEMLNEEEEETPDDYLMELGIEKIKNVPRIAIEELKKSTQQFTKYAYKCGPATSTKAENGTNAPNVAPLVNKNSLAKIRLEKKVAAGSVNENFVRLNLRKKVFVRGKKNFNYSRYKKTAWKQKKVAALSGPDMDMGGCDGGLLMCFQCGLPGHFAQNCTVKSDRLLPLSADVEESPFPTLLEVEEMSKQKILLAHGGRELPETDNPTWKTDQNETENCSNIAVSLELNNSTENNDKAKDAQPPQTYIGHKIPEDFLIKAGLMGSEQDDEKQIKPLYSLNDDGSLPDTPDEVFEALKMFGHSHFRNGQEKAVMRILSGQSTLVTLSTGSGKSLCYQLPAYLYSKKKRCITLVVSPLVSLMEDQVHGVPHFLNAQCLHTNQTKAKRDATMEMIKSGEVHVLLISPEAIVAGEKSTGFGSILRELPPIAFVCIDEAHCVSQWSHNFRPSYLMVCRVLHEKLKVKTVLGLTATATLTSRQSIVRHLMVPDGLDGVISDIPLPDNLTLTISCDENRDLALMRLLKEKTFAEFQSIIIYCSRRDECERVAKNLRTYFQDNIAQELQQRNAARKRKRTIKTTIEPYHAGIAASRRRTIQNAFMRGDLRIVVATIAFGMGINKADIRAVIHYNMPMNFESYVQEVGRAGRDGEPAHCHLFLDSKGGDKLELRRHIYANSIDRYVIRKLLQQIFIPCACKKSILNSKVATESGAIMQSDLDAVQSMNWNDELCEKTCDNLSKKRICPGHEVCFLVQDTISELDIPEENIATLLCYLELHEQRFVKVLSKAYSQCKVFSYGGPKALRNAALSCPPLAMAIALDLKKGISHDSSTFIEFPVIEIASAMGWNSGVVKYQLKNLEWLNDGGLPKRSNISVEFRELGFRVLAPGDLTDDELDSTLDLLYSRVKAQENNQISQLESVFRGLSSVSVKSALISAKADPNDERSEQLKALIRNYFQSNDKLEQFEETEEKEVVHDAGTDSEIISDICTMIRRYPENNFTGRALARIFHGIQSPVYPAVIWGKCKQWRSHMQTDFNHIVKLANMEILKSRT